jgi:hypothetical protein
VRRRFRFSVSFSDFLMDFFKRLHFFLYIVGNQRWGEWLLTCYSKVTRRLQRKLLLGTGHRKVGGSGCSGLEKEVFDNQIANMQRVLSEAFFAEKAKRLLSRIKADKTQRLPPQCAPCSQHLPQVVSPHGGC